MPVAEFASIDVLWIALSAFLVVVGLALAYALIRLPQLFGALLRWSKAWRKKCSPSSQRPAGRWTA